MIEIEYGMDAIASVQIKTDGSVEEMHRDSVEGVVKVRVRVTDWTQILLRSARRTGSGTRKLFVLEPGQVDEMTVLRYALAGEFDVVETVNNPREIDRRWKGSTLILVR